MHILYHLISTTNQQQVGPVIFPFTDIDAVLQKKLNDTPVKSKNTNLDFFLETNLITLSISLEEMCSKVKIQHFLTSIPKDLVEKLDVILLVKSTDFLPVYLTIQSTLGNGKKSPDTP